MKSNRLPIFLIFLLLMNCAGKNVHREEALLPGIEQPAVTVRLIVSHDNFVIRSEKSYILKCLSRRTSPPLFYESNFTRIMQYGNGMTMVDETNGAVEIGLKRITLLPGDDNSLLFLNSKPYRGALEVVFIPRQVEYSDSPTLMVLNIVNVEEYLRGVVPAEIGALREGEFEAIKAQSVAARTYALSKLGQYGEWGYDLESTVEDQVYRGVEGEAPMVDEAIKATKGIVLMQGDTPSSAYYHGNCGGWTEYIERVWDKSPESYLIPVKDDHCAWAKNYQWEETWDREDLETNLYSYLDTLVTFPEDRFGDLLDLYVKERSPSGRIEILAIDSEFASYEIERDRIRWAMRRGSDRSLILRSTLFQLDIERDSANSITRITAKGYGTGHGVGMCQTGAIGMARNGFSYREILAHYYQGVKLDTWGE